jgi:WD40 repeat protein
VLAGHSGSVAAVALTPDGRYALSGSADTTVRLWDLAAPVGTDPARHTFAGHTDTVFAVAFTPDGQYALSGAGDHTLRLWDLRQGTVRRTFAGHDAGVCAVAVTPDGRQALSGARDHRLILWDLATGAVVRTLDGHSRAIWAVAISPDGQRALSAGADDRVRLWDLAGGQLLWTGAWSPAVHDPDAFSYDRSWAVVFTADGQGAVSGADTCLHWWDLHATTPRQVVETYDDVYTLAIGPDARTVVVGQAAGLVKVWDRATPEGGTARRTLRANVGRVFALALSADRRGLVAGGGDSRLRAWTLPPDFFT